MSRSSSPARSCARPVGFADLGHRRDDRRLGDRQIDDRRADEPAQHGGEPADTHGPAALATERHGGALGLGEDLGDALALLGQSLPGRGQREAAPATALCAVDKAEAGLSLEPRQMLRHRRRAQVQRPRGGKHAAGALHGAQDEQAVGVEPHSVKLNQKCRESQFHKNSGAATTVAWS